MESGWFYAAWFCLFGAIALLVTQEKYGQRQAGIERRFQARSQSAAAPPRGQTAAEDVEADDQRGNADYSSPEDTVIPLWPLGGLLGVLACVFALLAYRSGIADTGALTPVP